MEIFMTNGLGNQLFILSYAHFMSRSTKVTLRVNVKPKKDREFLLEDFLTNSCSHNIKVRPASGFFFTLFRRIPLRLLETKYFPERHKSSLLKALRIVLESEVFGFEDFLLNLSGGLREVRGAFIHRSYVDAAWNQFGPELSQYLESLTPAKGVTAPQIVMHIRRGDSVRESELGRRTLLSADYYLQGLEFLINEYNLQDIKVVVCTDSKDEVREMLKGLEFQLIGPDDATPLESLSIMASSDYLICANSTLSWWAGRLAVDGGAVVLLPEPWDRSLSWPKSADLGIDGAFQLTHNCA
jgi:hypothetical protein